jgi:hypothetical protein
MANAFLPNEKFLFSHDEDSLLCDMMHFRHCLLVSYYRNYGGNFSFTRTVKYGDSRFAGDQIKDYNLLRTEGVMQL